MKSLKRFIKEFMQRTIPEEPNSTLIQNIPEKGLGLDAGAGDGRYADFLNNKDRMILSLDLNQPKKRKPDIQYIVGSIEYLPFKSDVFDFVYSLSVLQFLENDNQAVYELFPVLKAKQKFMFTVPTKYSTFHFLRELELYYNVYPYPEWNSRFYHYFSKTRINQLLNKNFSGKK